MKLSTRYTILSALALLLMVSCKPMPESERLIPNEIETTNGRAVLIEDYSGVGCSNCPNAAKVITRAAEVSAPYPKKTPRDYIVPMLPLTSSDFIQMAHYLLRPSTAVRSPATVASPLVAALPSGLARCNPA